MGNARVSVIIPTFNRAQLLWKAVESALGAGGDPEVIVVDDASTDATPEACRKFSNVRVIRLEKNVGLGAARNAGIRASTGDYIALLDDDDARLPDSLGAQVAALEANPAAALCYAPVFLGDSETGEATAELVPKELPRGDLFWQLLRGNFIPALSVLLRRGPLFDAGLFDPALRQVEDWDLWLRLSVRWEFTAVDAPVAIYRMFRPTSRQLSSNRALMARAAAAVQRRALTLPRATAAPERARICRESFLNVTRYTLLHESIDALQAGARKPARANLLAVARLLPSTLLKSEEFRALLRLSFTSVRREPRDFQKRLKAVRKQLWATGLSNPPAPSP